MALFVTGNRYLNKEEMTNNAKLIYSYLTKKGWSLNAIAGMLGNMESESTINPAIWQNLDNTNVSGGYGLVQWTPSTNYTDWANANGYALADGFGQLEWIDTQTVPFGQWIKTSEYDISFEEFKTSTKSCEWLASAFLKNFERAGVEVEEQRRSQAFNWFVVLSSGDEGEDEEEDVIAKPLKRKRFNFILFGQQRRKRWQL